MKYGAILCDPPWAFRTYTRTDAIAQRGPQYHYNTMTMEELHALPVAEWTAKDCALFMWVVDAHMEQALELGKAWSFSYKTCAFVWDKARVGMGYWTRKEAELCLLFTRGHPPRRSKSVRQIIRAPRREHSRKPDEIYSRIEALVDGPYLEVFARQRRKNWDAFGDEVGKFSGETVSESPHIIRSFGHAA